MDFATSYLKFIQTIESINRLKPAWLRNTLAAYYAQLKSPIKINKDKACQTLKNYLGEQCQPEQIWQAHLQQHGISSLYIFQLKYLTKSWSEKQIKINQPELFRQFCQNDQGAVMLTFHVQHQHQSCAVLGSYGLSINPLSAPPEISPLYSHLKKYIECLHENASSPYGQGNYVFLDPNNMNVRPAYRALNNKQVVVSLSDNVGNDNNNCEVLLFGQKRIVSTGMVKIAKKLNKPIWVAVLYWQSGDNYIFDIKKLDNTQPVDKIMQDYMDFFEAILVIRPELWEGWQW